MRWQRQKSFESWHSFVFAIFNNHFRWDFLYLQIDLVHTYFSVCISKEGSKPKWLVSFEKTIQKGSGQKWTLLGQSGRSKRLVTGMKTNKPFSAIFLFPLWWLSSISFLTNRFFQGNEFEGWNDDGLSEIIIPIRGVRW